MSVNHLQPAAQMPQYYQAPIMPQAQANQNNGMIWVQGIEGAKAYLVAPGKSIPLWDSEMQTIYIKSADPNGIPRPLTVIDYTIREPQPAIESPAFDTSGFATKEDLASIEDKLGGLANLVSELSEKLERKPNYSNKNKGGKYNE